MGKGIASKVMNHVCIPVWAEEPFRKNDGDTFQSGVTSIRSCGAICGDKELVQL